MSLFIHNVCCICDTQITVLHSSVIFFVNYFKINVYKTCLLKKELYICSIQNAINTKNYENRRNKKNDFTR